MRPTFPLVQPDHENHRLHILLSRAAFEGLYLRVRGIVSKYMSRCRNVEIKEKIGYC
jgi:hypothetical protein